MVVTELGGERRFASAVSKRMASMGALTKGDRRAASGSDLSEFDIDSTFGKRALARTCNALLEQPHSTPARNTNDILDKFIALAESADPKMKSDDDKRALALTVASKSLNEIGMASGDRTVKKFLNRIAGLDVARQNLIFSLFMATLDDVVSDAKATGEFEGSVEDIRGRVTLKGKPEVIAMDTSCAATTELTRLVLDRGISFDCMIQTIIQDQSDNEDSKDDHVKSNEELDEEEQHCKSGFYLSRRKIAGRYLVMFAKRKNELEDAIESDLIDPLKLMIITRPNTGKNPCEMASEEMRFKYKLLLSVDEIKNLLRTANSNDSLSGEEKKSDAEELPSEIEDSIRLIREKWGATVADLWDDAYDNSNYKDHHDGLAPRISEVGLITGAVLHILPSLEKAVQFLPPSQRALRVMRAEISDSGERIVGIKYPTTTAALERLMLGMKAVADARQGSLDVPSFVDESLTPVDNKSKNWATAERKTMKSFFGAKAQPSKSSACIENSSIALTKRKEPGSSLMTPSLSAKKQKSNSGVAKANSSITSFFGKKTG